MEIKVKPRMIVEVVIVIAIVVGGYFYMVKTAEIRKYKTEIKQLRLIDEHLKLEISVIRQRSELTEIKKGPQRSAPPQMPPMESPREQELSRKALEEANK